MKFDKETTIIMIICMVALFAWMTFFPVGTPPAKNPKDKITTEQQTSESKTTENTDKTLEEGKKQPEKTVEKKEVSATKPAQLPEKTDIPKLPIQNLSDDFIDATILPEQGTLESVILKKFLTADRKKKVDFTAPPKLGAFEVFSDKKWQLLNIKKDSPSPEKLSLTRTFSKDKQTFELKQEWELKSAYVMNYSISIKNLDSESLEFNDLMVSAGGIPPMRQLSGDDVQRENYSIEYFLADTNTVKSITSTLSEEEKDFQKQANDQVLKWIGVGNKYFACILLPATPFPAGNKVMRHELTWTNEKGNPQKYLYLATAGRIGRVVIDPQTLKEYKFKYFVGPKEIPVLKNFDESTTGIMHLSFLPDWFPGKSLFSLLAYWLLNALIFLKDSFCGTYGVSIIVLTLIVRTIFWPITQKANKSMKKMQKIQPMVKELKEKYPNDPQKMNSEVMRLYKEHKVNPLGGCLPILLQIPVFIALYSALYSSVELRQAAFLWASDLSRPDAIGPVIMGFQIHPLILIMTVLMLFQQKLTPSAADPMQQKMMMAMPLVMLVFLYSLPSGLTLYWTVSQIASIFQLLINRYLDKEEDQPVNPNQGTSKGKPGKPQKGELNK